MLPQLSARHCCLQEQLTQDYTSMIPSLTALARNMVRELDPQVRQSTLHSGHGYSATEQLYRAA
jgi:hypothetical protein